MTAKIEGRTILMRKIIFFYCNSIIEKILGEFGDCCYYGIVVFTRFVNW